MLWIRHLMRVLVREDREVPCQCRIEELPPMGENSTPRSDCPDVRRCDGRQKWHWQSPTRVSDACRKGRVFEICLLSPPVKRKGDVEDAAEDSWKTG